MRYFCTVAILLLCLLVLRVDGFEQRRRSKSLSRDRCVLLNEHMSLRLANRLGDWLQNDHVKIKEFLMNQIGTCFTNNYGKPVSKQGLYCWPWTAFCVFPSEKEATEAWCSLDKAFRVNFYHPLMADWYSTSGSKSHAKAFKACCEPVEKKCEVLRRDPVVYKSVKGTSPFHSDITDDNNLRAGAP